MQHEMGLYAIRPDGTGLRTIGTPYANDPSADPASAASPISFQDPVLSPDGSTILYWNWGSRAATPGYHPEAYLHGRDLTTGKDLPVLFDPAGANNPVGDDGGLLPRFSPDGTMVVFDSCPHSQSQLCYGTLDGSEPSRPIGPEFYWEDRVGFDFSPDGTKVILTMKSGSSIIDLETGVETPVLQGVPVQPGWQRLAP